MHGSMHKSNTQFVPFSQPSPQVSTIYKGALSVPVANSKPIPRDHTS